MGDRKYDLDERTIVFAKRCIDICRICSKDTINMELMRQLIRSSASIGANYREANNATTKKDFYPPSQKTTGLNPWMNATGCFG